MYCVDAEILIADYVDGTLHGEQKSALAEHLFGCASCAELARDAAAAVAFMDRAAEVEPPPELVTRLLYEISSGASKALVKPPLSRRLFGKWGEAILQPRFAMGMAMTMLSLTIFLKAAGIPQRQLKLSDLDPVKVWASTEDRAMRLWARGVKYYENLRVVYEIQSRIQEWKEEDPAAQEQPVSPNPASNPSKDGKK